jgi:PAS domain S-box-containing protein
MNLVKTGSFMTKLPDIDYHDLFHSLPGRYVVFQANDPDFTIVEENQAHAKMAYVKREDVIGKSLFEVWPDTSEQYRKSGKSELLESLRKVIRTKKPDSMPLLRYDIPGPKGVLKEKYWRITHFPIFDNSGKVSIVYQATEDITHEIDTDKRLKQVERELEEARSIGSTGTWLWDIPNNLVFADKFFSKIFGVPAEEGAHGLPLARFIDQIHPQDRQRVEDAIKEALDGKDTYETEYRTMTPDGGYRWIIARGQLERNEKGMPIRFPGVIMDITDRKHAEENLRFLTRASAVLSSSLDYKQTLQSLTELAVPDLADWCTLDLYTSDKSSVELVGLAHKDPAKVKWARQLRDQQPVEMDAPSGLPNVLRTGKPELYPYIPDELLVASAKSKEHLRLMREIGFTSVIITPLIIEHENIGALTLVSTELKRHYNERDLEMAEQLAGRAALAISNANLYENAQKELRERKRLEERLRKANESLEAKVRKRTQQLEETNTNLERSNRELQDFAYVASHDLQEPLRKIQAFGNLLEDEYGKQLGDGRDYLERMRNAAARMSALIEDLLAFSRVTTKAKAFIDVDLNTVAHEVLGDLETRVSDTGGQVIIEKLPTIEADPLQMRQLLQNLMANALKFHKQGEAPVVKISASFKEGTKSNPKYCTLLVEDNGVGFDEKYLDRIFAVFQRLHGKGSFEGTGIGLAVCRKIVERHQGTITARSIPDKGSTFVVRLPVHHDKRKEQ